jgi:glycosyltransferase involved in cell wall biosynthesis
MLVDGDGQRQFLIKQGVLKESNSCVLANGSITGVELDKFVVSDETRTRERDRFGFKESDVVYIFLGRLNHDKGIGELFSAFDKLVSEYDNAKLVFYGSDEEGYEAKSLNYPNIKRNINFFYPGRTSKPYDALQGGDVFVLPTWREGFGSSVIEAQALALPVITSDAYGVADASVEGVTGLRCKVGDANGLYQCMKQYYLDSDLRKKHGEEGRKRVVELFDNNLVTQAWVDFYISILN